MTSWVDTLTSFTTNRGAWVQFATKTGGVGAYNPMTRKKLYGADALAVLQAKDRHAAPDEHGLQHGAGEDDVDKHASSVVSTGEERTPYKKEWGNPEDWTEGKDAWGNVIVRHKDGTILKRGAAQSVIAEKKKRAGDDDKKPKTKPGDEEETWTEGKDQWGNRIAKSSRGRVVKGPAVDKVLGKKPSEPAKKDAKAEPEEDDERGDDLLLRKMKQYADDIKDPTERAAMLRIVNNTAGDDKKLFWQPFIPKDKETLARFQPHIDELQRILDIHHGGKKFPDTPSVPSDEDHVKDYMERSDAWQKRIDGAKDEAERKKLIAEREADMEQRGARKLSDEGDDLPNEHRDFMRSLAHKHEQEETELRERHNFEALQGSSGAEYNRRGVERQQQVERHEMEKRSHVAPLGDAGAKAYLTARKEKAEELKLTETDRAMQRERDHLGKKHDEQWKALGDKGSWVEKSRLRRKQADELARLLAKHAKGQVGTVSRAIIFAGSGQKPETRQPMRIPEPLPQPTQPPERTHDPRRHAGAHYGVDPDHLVETFDKLKHLPFSHWHPEDQAALRKAKDLLKNQTRMPKWTPEQKLAVAHVALYEAHSRFEEWGIESNIAEFDDIGGGDLTKSQLQRQTRNRIDMLHLADDMVEVVGKYAQKGVKPVAKLVVLSAGDYKKQHGKDSLALYTTGGGGLIALKYPPGGYDEMNKSKTDSMESGFTVEGDGYKTTIHHEIGHALHDQYGDNKFNTLYHEYPYHEWRRTSEPRWHKELDKDGDLDLTLHHLSQYATKHPNEYVAEMHAALSMGRKMPEHLIERYKALGGVVPHWVEDPVDHTLPDVKTQRIQAATRQFKTLERDLITYGIHLKQNPTDDFVTKRRDAIKALLDENRGKFRDKHGVDPDEATLKSIWSDYIRDQEEHVKKLPDVLAKASQDEQWKKDSLAKEKQTLAHAHAAYKERWGDEHPTEVLDKHRLPHEEEHAETDERIINSAAEFRGTMGLTGSPENAKRFNEWFDKGHGASMVVRAKVLEAHVARKHGQMNLSEGALAKLATGIGDDDAKRIMERATREMQRDPSNEAAKQVIEALSYHGPSYGIRALHDENDDIAKTGSKNPTDHWLHPDNPKNKATPARFEASESGGTVHPEKQGTAFREGLLSNWGMAGMGTRKARIVGHEVGRTMGFFNGIDVPDHHVVDGVKRPLGVPPNDLYEQAQTLYEETQKHYSEKDTKTLKLWKLPQRGEDIRETQALERWTDDEATAKKKGATFSRDIPVHHIFASHHTHGGESGIQPGQYAVIAGTSIEPTREDPRDIEMEAADKNWPHLADHASRKGFNFGDITDSLQGKTIKDKHTGRTGVVKGGGTHPDFGMHMPKVHWEGDMEPSHLDVKQGESFADQASRYVIAHPRDELGHVRPKPRPPEQNADRRSVEQRVMVGDLIVVIENRAGSVRSGTDKNGRVWQTTMQHAYGRISGYVGADGEAVDVFVGPDTTSRNVFIVNQVRQEDPSQFDEHKVMLGFRTRDEAVQAYLSNYEQGWKCGPVKQTSMEQFKNWLRTGDTTIAVNRKEEKTVTTNAKKPGLFASLKRLFGRNDSTTDAPKAPPAAAPLLAGFTGFADRMGLARGTSAYDAVLADYVRGMVLDTRTQLWGGAPGAPVDAPPIPAPWDFPRAEWVRIVTERAAGLQQGVDLTRLWDEAVALRS